MSATAVPHPPRTRLILLGASNLAIGLPHALAAAQNTFQSPLDVFTAIGRGRSLGEWSSVLFRAIPGILQCRLWAALHVADVAPTAQSLAVISDIGNDIMYGVPPDHIAAWASEIILRLHAHHARTLLVLPPIARISQLSPAAYYLARSVIFPRRRMSFSLATSRALNLNQLLLRLALDLQIPTIAPPASWYGIDPIHIRRSSRSSAWRDIMSALALHATALRPASLARFSLPQVLRLRTLCPAHYRFLGINVQARTRKVHRFTRESTIQLF